MHSGNCTQEDSEFDASLGYIVRSCFKIPKKPQGTTATTAEVASCYCEKIYIYNRNIYSNYIINNIYEALSSVSGTQSSTISIIINSNNVINMKFWHITPFSVFSICTTTI